MPDPFACPDPLAERRYVYARAAADDGEWRTAVEMCEQALERAPGWAPALFGLAQARESLGDREGAEAAYRATLAADPPDRQGAAPRLARLRGGSPPALPPAFVARLFDDYAPRFERHLNHDLGYRAPALLAEALDRVAAGRRFSRALDLGCGSGLAGVALRGRIDALIGVDLSARMIAKAQETGVYDALEIGELVAFVRAQPAGAADLVFAADALVYIGDLTLLFAAAAKALAPDGLFALTLESALQGDYALGPALRYRHSQAHLVEAAASASLRLRSVVSASARREAQADVPGLVAVLQRQAGG